MRGRKIDTEFLTKFITSCVEVGKFSSEDILKEAKNKIEQIDQKIIEVENLRILRSKLLDVVLTFDKAAKEIKPEEAKILTFFKIQDQHICKFICDKIKCSTINIDCLKDGPYDTKDILFCIKQLIEHKIISKVGDILLRGELYDEYVKFVLRDNNE